jgi:hypothetical protein
MCRWYYYLKRAPSRLIYSGFLLEWHVKNLTEEKKNHYTYIIINQVNGKMYIGVRSCECEPMFDLGVKYFSSSKDKELIKDQRENKADYSYQILGRFDERAEAIRMEIELHNLHDVGKSDLFYNRAKQTSTGFDISGTKHSEEQKGKMSAAHKGKKGRKHSEESKRKMRKSMKGIKPSDEAKKKMSESQKRRRTLEGRKRYYFNNCKDRWIIRIEDKGKTHQATFETEERAKMAYIDIKLNGIETINSYKLDHNKYKF